MPRPFLAMLLPAALAAAPTVSHAALSLPLSITFETELTSMDLSGTSLIPLGANYSLVDSTIRVTESPTETSLSSLSVTLDRPDPAAPLSVVLTLDQTARLFYEVEITPSSGGFAPGVADPLHIVPADPLSLTTHVDATFDLLAGTQSVSEVTSVTGDRLVHPLGVDTGGAPDPDFLKLQATSLTIDDVSLSGGSAGPITLEPGGGTVFDATLLADIVSQFTGGGSITSELSFTSGSLTLSGAVTDNIADPPFGPVVLSGPIATAPIPLPPAVWLLAPAIGLLVGLFGRGRRA